MQPSIFDVRPSFDGPDLQPHDTARLTAQLAKVRTYMLGHGEWRSLAEIAAATGEPEASVSARLRDCRKVKHGGYSVERRRRSAGCWEYRMSR